MCSNVPDTFEVKPFWIWCSMKPLCFRKVKRESRRQEVNIFKGTDSKVIGLKFDGSSVLSFL